MTRRLTIAPWRPRILEAEAPPNAFVLEMSITEAVQRLTPRIFDPEWHEDIVASGLNWPEVYRFSHMMGVATDLTYVFAALDNFHAKKLLRRVHEAESLQFHILATSGDRAVLLVKPEGRRDGHRPTIRCAFAQPLVHLKTSWTSDCARAERDIEARIPRDAHYRAIERDQALSHALAELAARWARAIRDELAFGVVVHDAVLVRRLGAAIQRADSSAFAANFEALLADSGIEVARDGHYAVTAATCPRTRTQVLLVEFQPRQPQTTVFDIAEATEHLVPQALATPRLSGWSRPSMPGQGSGQRCLPLDGRATPGRIPEIDVLAERFEGNPRIEEAARAADAQQRAAAEAVWADVKREGTEAIAWWQGFHDWDAESWGIYFDVQKVTPLVLALYDEIRDRCNAPATVAATVLLRAIWAHELFHARVEFAGAAHELNTGKPCLRSYRANVYDPHAFKATWLEEALANHAAFESASEAIRMMCPPGQSSPQLPSTLSAFIVKFLDQSPAGYREWRMGLATAAGDRLAACLRAGREFRRSLPPTGRSLTALPLDFAPSDVPLYFVGHSPVMDALYSPPPFAATEVYDGDKRFQKALAKLPQRVQAEWQAVKTDLKCGTVTPGRDFKLWERRAACTIYSVRLDLNYRAHLASVDKECAFRALDVGTHRAMGHG